MYILNKYYSGGEVTKLGCIPGSANSEESLTKDTVRDESPLISVMRSTFLRISPMGWATVVTRQKEDIRNLRDNTKNGEVSVDKGGGIDSKTRCPSVMSSLETVNIEMIMGTGTDEES